MPDDDSLRSLIGGRWAVSWRGYMLGWPFAVMFIFFSFPSIVEAPSIGQRLLNGVCVGTVAYAAAGMVFWLADISVLKHRRERPATIATVACIGGLAWTARTLAIQAYLHLEHLPSRLGISQHLVIGFLQGVFAAILAAWLLATLETFRTRRGLLVNQLVAEELAAERLSHEIAGMRSRVLESMRESVRVAGRQLADTDESSLTSAHGAALLRETSNRLSHEVAPRLWREANRSSRLNVATVVRSAMANRPFAYWAFLPTVIVSMATLSTMWPAAKAAILLSALALYSTAISLAANTLAPRLQPRHALIAYLAAVSALMLGSPMVAEAMVSLLDLTPPSGLAILPITALNFGVLVPLLGLAAHVGTVRTDILDRLRRSIDVAEIQREALRREEERLRRDLAVALHGGLQADLTALSMRSQQAVDAGDLSGAQSLLAHGRALLDQALDGPSASTRSLREVVDGAVLAWSGLVDIDCHVAVTRDLPSRTVKAVEDVLLEGIGNAVRHGSARSIGITIRDDGSRVHISIADDGTGVSRHRRGLGSAVLDELAPNAWALEPRSAGGTVLAVELSAA